MEEIQIEKLYNDLLKSGLKPIHYKNYEILQCSNLKIKTLGNKFVNLLYLSRHKTPKHLIQFLIRTNISVETVTVTTDHICMIYNRDKFFENKSADEIKVGDYVSVYNKEKDIEVVGVIIELADLGTTNEYVYDCEVDDENHSFYADNILIHNSQFLNLKCISQHIREKYNLPRSIKDWKQKHRQELWDTMNEFVNKDVNQFVRDLVHNYCHTTQQNVLTYELEYISDVGIYEGKKHYATHKIFEEGDAVNKTKYSGIELKKAQVPKEVKAFLAEIYNNVLLNDWGEKEYNNYISDLYTKFQTFTIDEISFWKGYNTEKASVGFLQMSKGTTGIAKACTYTNQIIKKLGLAKKYEEIRVGDKVRFCYIDPNNMYNINCIAYKPGQYPDEFRELFKPDYYTMFNKIILDPLKRFREACKFEDIDPSCQAEFDVFEL